MDYYSALWVATIILMVPLVYSVNLLMTTTKVLNARFNKYTESMKQQRKTMHAHVGKQWDMENKQRKLTELKLQDKDTPIILQKQLDQDYDKLLAEANHKYLKRQMRK